MRGLLDVCALIALIDANHVNHVKVGAWFTQNPPNFGWASCPLTQNGVARIIGHKTYPNRQPTQAVLARLQAMCANQNHQFWPDSISLLDPLIFNQGVVLTSDDLTDVYLLGLAKSQGGRLITTDSRILTNAVVGFQNADLVVL